MQRSKEEVFTAEKQRGREAEKRFNAKRQRSKDAKLIVKVKLSAVG
jgi:hypothetical protein